MKILSFEHVQLDIPKDQEDIARSFYCGVLGMAEIDKPLALANRGGAWFQTGIVNIHLAVEPDFRPNRRAHPALVVEDLSGFLEVCRAHGIVTDTTQPALPGFIRAHIYDPFGNRIELMEKLQS